jgi:hypothetical protein
MEKYARDELLNRLFSSDNTLTIELLLLLISKTLTVENNFYLRSYWCRTQQMSLYWGM